MTYITKCYFFGVNTASKDEGININSNMLAANAYIKCVQRDKKVAMFYAEVYGVSPTGSF